MNPLNTSCFSLLLLAGSFSFFFTIPALVGGSTLGSSEGVGGEGEGVWGLGGKRRWEIVWELTKRSRVLGYRR